MNKEIMQKWVAALRSGEYKQIDGRLRSYEPDECGKYSYCCLGVLCDLHRQEAGGEWGLGAMPSTPDRTTTAYTGHVDNLPPVVCEWAGIRRSDPEVLADPDGNGQYDLPLSSLNDDHSFEFAELAEIIEDQWEDL